MRHLPYSKRKKSRSVGRKNAKKKSFSLKLRGVYFVESDSRKGLKEEIILDIDEAGNNCIAQNLYFWFRIIIDDNQAAVFA